MTEQCVQKKLWFKLREPTTVDLEIKCAVFQILAFCTAKSWQGGWDDLFSKSLWLPQLPKGLFPSVLGPSGGRRGGLFLCCWELADKRLCYCVSAWWETYEEQFFQGVRAALGEDKLGREGRCFIRSLSRWPSLGLPCLKKKELEMWGQPNVSGWRPDFIYTSVVWFAAQRSLFPGVPDSSSPQCLSTCSWLFLPTSSVCRSSVCSVDACTYFPVCLELGETTF